MAAPKHVPSMQGREGRGQPGARPRRRSIDAILDAKMVRTRTRT